MNKKGDIMNRFMIDMKFGDYDLPPNLFTFLQVNFDFFNIVF